jgi:hypothetical protein
MSQINSYAKSDKNDLCKDLLTQVISTPRLLHALCDQTCGGVTVAAGIFPAVSTSN